MSDDVKAVFKKIVGGKQYKEVFVYDDYTLLYNEIVRVINDYNQSHRNDKALNCMKIEAKDDIITIYLYVDRAILFIVKYVSAPESCADGDGCEIEINPIIAEKLNILRKYSQRYCFAIEALKNIIANKKVWEEIV